MHDGCYSDNCKHIIVVILGLYKKNIIERISPHYVALCLVYCTTSADNCTNAVDKLRFIVHGILHRAINLYVSNNECVICC